MNSGRGIASIGRRWGDRWRRLGPVVGRGRRRLADRKAEAFGRWVAGAPAERLEAVMRGPLRRVLLWQIFSTMRQRFDGDRSPSLLAVVEFRISRSGSRVIDRYQLGLADGRCATTRDGRRVPTVTLELDPVSFLHLVGGAAGAARLLLAGRLRIRGDVLLAARLPRLLNVPRNP